MRKARLLFTFLIAMATVQIAQAQEINATVNVLSPSIQMTNKEIFTVLETSIRQFVNSYKWTSLTYELEERIECSFILTITSFQNNSFGGTMQIQYSRPVFGTSYNSPVLNFIDSDLQFNYIINEPLEYQPNANISNLTSILAFYCNMIIGLDRSTFELRSGGPFFNQMQNIVSMAQSSGAPGWRSFDGSKSRFWLSDNLNSPAFAPIFDCFYNYHRNGLDRMSDPDKQLEAKTVIKNSLMALQVVFQNRQNALILNTFFDAKSDEIVNVFADGPELDLKPLVAALKLIDAGRTNKYETLIK